MKTTVVGAGAWGTALANLLARNGHDVTLWGHDAVHLTQMRKEGENRDYLPGAKLAPSLKFDADLQ